MHLGDVHAVAARIAGRAVPERVHPTVEAGRVRFAAEEVEILLAHKEFSRIDRVCVIAVGRRRERRFRVHAQRAEAAIRGIERVVRARRRDGVEAVRLDAVEAVVPLRVGDRLAILRPTQVNRGAGQSARRYCR